MTGAGMHSGMEDPKKRGNARERTHLVFSSRSLSRMDGFGRFFTARAVAEGRPASPPKPSRTLVSATEIETGFIENQ